MQRRGLQILTSGFCPLNSCLSLVTRHCLKAMAQNAIDFLKAHPLILALIRILIVLLVLSGIVAYLV